MRSLISAVVLTGLLVASAAPVLAQADSQAGAPPAGRMGGRGFGMGQPVQGTVTAAGADKVTIKTAAGDLYDVTAGTDARVMKDRQPIHLGDIKVGDMVMAMGQVDAGKKTVQARFVNDVDAATVAKAKENLGKTYIVGRVTAIDPDNLKLTIMRNDDVSQTIAVDDGTSFQRGNRGVAADVMAAGGMPMGGGMMGGRGMGMGRMGQQGGPPPAPESITLADIKAGDMVMATGSVKNGVFTAQKMGVTEPGAGRRGAPGGQAPPPPRAQ